MSKKIKISNFQDFKNLNRREIMEFKKSDDKDFGKHFLKSDIKQNQIKEIIKGLRYVNSGFDKVNLKKPISNYFKNKAENILNEYFTFSKRRNVQVVTPRKRNRKLLGELAQQNSKWKKYYIANEGTEKTKIKYKKRNGKKIISVTTKVMEFQMMYFDMIQLAIDSDAEIERVLKDFKPKTQKKFKKSFKLMAGDHLITDGEGSHYGDIGQVKLGAKKLMLKYNGQEGMTDHQDWLFGVRAIVKFTGKKKK